MKLGDSNVVEMTEYEKLLVLVREKTEFMDIPGWYFKTEGEGLEGPFDCRKDALDACFYYCEAVG